MSKESQRFYDVHLGAQHAARGDVCGKGIDDYDPPLTEHERKVYMGVYEEEKRCMRTGDHSHYYVYPDLD